jgi:hypothetical protein
MKDLNLSLTVLDLEAASERATVKQYPIERRAPSVTEAIRTIAVEGVLDRPPPFLFNGLIYDFR